MSSTVEKVAKIGTVFSTQFFCNLTYADFVENEITSALGESEMVPFL